MSTTAAAKRVSKFIAKGGRREGFLLYSLSHTHTEEERAGLFLNCGLG